MKRFFDVLGATFVVVGAVLMTFLSICTILFVTMMRALWHR